MRRLKGRDATTSGVNIGMADYPAREVTVSVTAGGPIGTGARRAPTASNAVSDSGSYNDGNASTGVIGTVGNVTANGVSLRGHHRY